MSSSEKIGQGSYPSLNKAQREAVEHFEGPLLVLAGAGSGKTRVLTTRIANLIENHGVSPAEILAVTFTNKAAGEMKERIGALIGHAPPSMWIGTFHALGARMLRLHARGVRRTSGFTIYDPDDAASLIKQMIDTQRIDIGDLNARAIQAAISDAKNRMISAAEFESLARDPFSKVVARVYNGLEAALQASNAVTFDDLLTLPLQLLLENETIRTQYQRKFRFILVDEYQDTNRVQYRLISLLGAKHKNVAVVGDDDQSIYGWRGAEVRNILDFEKGFPGARVVRLEENYRSTPGILSVANAIIKGNTERRGKTLRPTLPPGEAVSLTPSLDERDEADFIADEIQSRRSRERQIPLRDFAVIYRTNAQSRILEEVFRRRSIPYRLVGALSFFERREVKDILGYLRLIANPSDDVAFLRAISVPRRGTGTGTLEKLSAAARESRIPLLEAAGDPHLTAALRPAARGALASFSQLITRLSAMAAESPVPELIGEIVASIKYENYLTEDEGAEKASERMDNVRELASSAAALTEDITEEVVGTRLDVFLQRAALIAQIDTLDPDADAVALMTVHNAKGLEFPVVFISGLEDGLFPLSRSADEPELLAEERRLLYVGVTRAERKLYLSYAATRRRNGELKQATITSFLRHLPRSLWVEQPTMRFRSNARPPQAPPPMYSTARRTTYGVPARRPRPAEEDISQETMWLATGSRVKHERFGTGTITDISGQGREAKVTVDFDDESVGRKRLVVAYAGLQSGWDE